MQLLYLGPALDIALGLEIALREGVERPRLFFGRYGVWSSGLSSGLASGLTSSSSLSLVLGLGLGPGSSWEYGRCYRWRRGWGVGLYYTLDGLG